MENNAPAAQVLRAYALTSLALLLILGGAAAAAAGSNAPGPAASAGSLAPETAAVFASPAMGQSAYSHPGSGLCPIASRSITVPAVVENQEGDLLRITATTQPGSGDVLTTVEPMVGLSTQDSQKTAVQEAFRGLDISPERCEVHFYIQQGMGAPSVDGPSAGMAMTVALRAALTNQSIRPDVSVTGAILPGGRAGPVGGIIDKAQASARGGMSAIITPRQQLYENILLQRLGQERNFSSVEVRSLDEAMAVAASPAGRPIEPHYDLQNEPLPANLAQWKAGGEEQAFGRVARSLNDLLAARLQAGGVFAQPLYGDYFRRQIDDNSRLISMGYGYTAANNAFLSQVDAAFLTLPAHDPDVEGEADRVLDCIRRAPAVNLSASNFEWAAGGSARMAWSLQKIEDVKKNVALDTSSEERYIALREVYYAQAWCDAGTQLLYIARENGGGPVNDSALALLARASVRGTLSRLADSPLADGDMQWHAMIANRSLVRHEWAAALFDAAYVQGSLDAAEAQGAEDGQANETNAPSPGRPSPSAALITGDSFSSLWGRVYASQGAYLQAQDPANPGAADVRRVESMARRMDELMELGVQAAGRQGQAGWLEQGNPISADAKNGIGNWSAGSRTQGVSGAAAGGQAGTLGSLRLSDALVALVLLLMVLALGVGIGRAIEKMKRRDRGRR